MYYCLYRIMVSPKAGGRRAFVEAADSIMAIYVIREEYKQKYSLMSNDFEIVEVNSGNRNAS